MLLSFQASHFTIKGHLSFSSKLNSALCLVIVKSGAILCKLTALSWIYASRYWNLYSLFSKLAHEYYYILSFFFLSTRRWSKLETSVTGRNNCHRRQLWVFLLGLNFPDALGFETWSLSRDKPVQSLPTFPEPRLCDPRANELWNHSLAICSNTSTSPNPTRSVHKRPTVSWACRYYNRMKTWGGGTLSKRGA